MASKPSLVVMEARPLSPWEHSGPLGRQKSAGFWRAAAPQPRYSSALASYTGLRSSGIFRLYLFKDVEFFPALPRPEKTFWCTGLRSDKTIYFAASTGRL
jgi:hypothetical protein